MDVFTIGSDNMETTNLSKIKREKMLYTINEIKWYLIIYLLMKDRK